MAGGGGAFFHPSHTNVHEVPHRVLYPKAAVSRKEVAKQIFKFRNICNGGWVWLFGFLIAFSLFFAASFPHSSKDAVDSFAPWVALHISPGLQGEVPLTAYVKQMPRETDVPDKGRESVPFFLRRESVPFFLRLERVQFFLWMSALPLSVITLFVALCYSAKLFSKEYVPAGTAQEIVLTQWQRYTLWALVLASFLLLLFGLIGFYGWEKNITRYGRSLIVLVALIWSLLAIIESVWYSEWLFEKAYHENVKANQYWPIWALLIMSVLGFGASLWLFGEHEAKFLVSDLLHLIILLAVGGGLIYFAYGVGAHLKKGVGKAGFLLLGFSHALLQIAVPFLLVRKGHLLWAVVAALLAAVGFKYVGRWLAGMKNGWWLAAAWVVFGAVLLAIPFIIGTPQEYEGVKEWLRPVFFENKVLNIPDRTWVKFLLCGYAGAIGAVMSCVLFGSYLAVALGFNGHNNEAGGAARIEGFKQFIRFRINREGLTGYVIGIDVSGTEGGQGKLRPKIIDIFHVREK
jgi:hypothetical protein